MDSKEEDCDKSKTNDEQRFKWAVIVALHLGDIKHHPERNSLLQHYEDQYNWQGLEFLLAIQKIGKFERNNPGIVVDVLLNSKKGQYTAYKLERNRKCSKQANLLMIVDGGNRHYTAIKNISRLLISLNATHKGAYHFCINFLNGFATASARDMHYEHSSSNGHVKVKMSFEM